MAILQTGNVQDHAQILHWFLREAWGELTENTATLIAELLGQFPDYATLEKEKETIEAALQKASTDLEKNKSWYETLEKTDDFDWKENALTALATKITSWQEAVQRLENKKKLIEERIIYDILHHHWNEMKTMHGESENKVNLEKQLEANDTTLQWIAKEVEARIHLMEQLQQEKQILEEHLATITKLLAADWLTEKISLQAYADKIWEKQRSYETANREKDAFEQQKQEIEEENEQLGKQIAGISVEWFDADHFWKLEKFLWKDEEQLYASYKEQLTPEIEKKMRESRSWDVIKLLTGTWTQLKTDSSTTYWFTNTIQHLKSQHPDIPEESITRILMDAIKESFTPSLLCELSAKDARTLRERQEKIKKQQAEREKLDTFSQQFTEWHSWYTNEGKEKIQHALWYTSDDQRIKLYVPNENWDNREREISFDSIDRAIGYFFRDIQDCLRSWYTYDEERWNYFSSNYTEKLKLLREVKETIKDTSDPTDDAQKIKEFIKKIIRAAGQTDYTFVSYKNDKQLVSILPSKERLHEVKEKTDAFTRESSTLRENYYTQRSAITRRMYRTDTSNSSYPLPQNIPSYFPSIRNTDTYGTDAPDKKLQWAYKSVQTYTENIRTNTQDGERYENDSSILTVVIENLKNPPKIAYVAIDSRKLLQNINNIPWVTEALERNNITFPETLDWKNIPKYIELITSTIKSLNEKKEQNEKNIQNYTQKRLEAITTLNNQSLYIQYYTGVIDSYVEKCKKAELGSNSITGQPDSQFPLYVKHKAQIEADKKNIEEQIAGFFKTNTFSLENCETCQNEFNKLLITPWEGIATYWKELKEDSTQAAIDNATCLRQRQTTQTAWKELWSALEETATKKQ